MRVVLLVLLFLVWWDFLGGCFFFFFVVVGLVFGLVFAFNGKELEISKTMHVGTCEYEIILLFQKQFSPNSASLFM